jgi:hypothetical protein
MRRGACGTDERGADVIRTSTVVRAQALRGFGVSRDAGILEALGELAKDPGLAGEFFAGRAAFNRSRGIRRPDNVMIDVSRIGDDVEVRATFINELAHSVVTWSRQGFATAAAPAPPPKRAAKRRPAKRAKSK